MLLARGRACGGSHGAFICTEKKYLPAETPVPVRASTASATTTTSSKAKPSASTKRRREASPQPSAWLEAAEAPSPRPKTPPKAPPHKAVPPKLMKPRGPRDPSPPPLARTPPWRQPTEPAPSTLPIPAVSPGPQQSHWDRLATSEGRDTLAPTLIMTTRSGGQLWLSSIPIAETVQHFPKAHLQIACLPQYPEGRGGCRCRRHAS